MKPLREWDYPQLFVCYAVLLCFWLPSAYLGTMLLMANAHALRDQPGLELPLSAELFPATLAVLAIIVIPGLAVLATVRVFLNELRWRREGDPRAR
jgi:hypothetical protein